LTSKAFGHSKSLLILLLLCATENAKQIVFGVIMEEEKDEELKQRKL